MAKMTEGFVVRCTHDPIIELYSDHAEALDRAYKLNKDKVYSRSNHRYYAEPLVGNHEGA